MEKLGVVKFESSPSISYRHTSCQNLHNLVKFVVLATNSKTSYLLKGLTL
jgi:hypothetical protein